MKNFRNRLSSLLVGLRPFAIALACALMVFSSAAPAFAFGNSNSRPEKGLEQLDTVQEKSEEAISGPIDNANDGESVIRNSAKGLNGVQGDANKKEMVTRGSAEGNTIEGNIKEALEKVTP
ncbi:MAG: hypothetical protein WBA76_07455 [Phormidesmis sp.]